MPELPEVETMRRSIAAAAGCRIRGVERPSSRLHPISIAPPLATLRRRTVGRTIVAVGRVGKRIVLELEPECPGRPHPNPLPKGEGTIGRGDCLILEPRMTGIVLPADPPNEKHLRLVIHLAGGRLERILFWDQRGLGEVHLLSRAEFLRRYDPGRLGPDALTITADALRDRLGASRRPIKVALLDQRAVAGIGNIYAAEVLHVAGIHPARPCRRLDADDWSRLCRAIRKVLQAAIRHRGSTLGDNTYRVARDRRGGYQAYHRVYQRAGRPCLECGHEIVRIVQAQRSTFFCPVCQPACGVGRKR